MKYLLILFLAVAAWAADPLEAPTPHVVNVIITNKLDTFRAEFYHTNEVQEVRFNFPGKTVKVEQTKDGRNTIRADSMLVRLAPGRQYRFLFVPYLENESNLVCRVVVRVPQNADVIQ